MDPLDPILAGLTPPQAEAAMHDGAILVLPAPVRERPAPSPPKWHGGLPVTAFQPTACWLSPCHASLRHLPHHNGDVATLWRCSRVAGHATQHP